MGILEATHRPALARPAVAEGAWAEEFLDAFRRAFAFDRGVGLSVLEHDPALRRIRIPVWLPPAWMRESNVEAEQLLGALSSQAFRAFFLVPGVARTHLGMSRHLRAPDAHMMAEYRRMNGLADVFGLVVQPLPGTLVAIYGGSRTALELSLRERRLLMEIGLHLEAGFRMVRRPGAVKGEITTDGAVVWRSEDLPPAATLARDAAAIGAARRAGRGRVEGVDVWKALVDGRYGVVEAPQRGRRHYFLLENEPPVRAMRALTKREVTILSMAARGMSVKLIAYGLGVSSPSVSRALRAAASKIGVVGPIELVRLAVLLARTPRAALDEMDLTESERAVLALIQQGLSNAGIAAARGRSVRTVANQVASLLRKTGSPSRRALVARESSP